jgi:hypothetical protein
MVSVFLYHVVGDLTVGKPDSTFSLLLLGVSRQTNEGLRTVFLYHVVGDLTVGKLEIVEFLETKTVESASNARRRTAATSGSSRTVSFGSGALGGSVGPRRRHLERRPVPIPSGVSAEREASASASDLVFSGGRERGVRERGKRKKTIKK